MASNFMSDGMFSLNAAKAVLKKAGRKMKYHVTGEVPHIKIFLLGETGVGKSKIGTWILQDLKKNKKKISYFKAAGRGKTESETAEVSFRSAVVNGVQLTLFDTPGLADTKGRSLLFLDNIMKTIKREKPHALIFVTAWGKIDTKTKLVLRTFSQCFKTTFLAECCIPLEKCMLIVNKLEPVDEDDDDEDNDESSEENDNKLDKESLYRQIILNYNRELKKSLSLPCIVPLTFGIERSKKASYFRARMEELQAMLLHIDPDDQIDTSSMRTFTEVEKAANRLMNDALSSSQEAQIELQRIAREKDTNRYWSVHATCEKNRKKALKRLEELLDEEYELKTNFESVIKRKKEIAEEWLANLKKCKDFMLEK